MRTYKVSKNAKLGQHELDTLNIQESWVGTVVFRACQYQSRRRLLGELKYEEMSPTTVKMINFIVVSHSKVGLIFIIVRDIFVLEFFKKPAAALIVTIQSHKQTKRPSCQTFATQPYKL